MPGLYIGLMSGTSVDGIDAVLAADDARPAVRGHIHHPMPQALRDTLLALNTPGSDELHRAALAANALSLEYAVAIRALLAQEQVAARDIVAVGCHGQTVRHRPDAGYTVHLVNGALLAELSGIRVVCDFRSRDIAAGGQGAPLVPAFHHAAFAAPLQARAIVNIGGIANITSLPARGNVIGFDCGPGNVLLDGWIRRQRSLDYDADGTWAKEGKVLPGMLEHLLGDAYFNRPPPKSTGRDLFHLDWIQPAMNGDERPADVQATLLELTAATIARALTAHCAGTTEVYLCGGGVRNTTLRERIAALLPGRRVAATDQLGIAAESVEATAFAWLAARTLAHEPGNLPAVTGARGLRVLGAIYPA